jgi:hypothetical protein
MKYLCLIYGDESQMPAPTRDRPMTMMAEYHAFTEDIRKSGHLLAGEALQRTATATTVRIRSGNVSMTDGPFAETKEQLGGFYMIEAADLNEAVAIAARIPGAKTGSVEVRPVQVFS